MAERQPAEVIAGLGRHFGVGGVTWTIATGTVQDANGLREVMVIAFETSAGTIGVQLAKADAQRFADQLRQTLAGLIVPSNGQGAAP